MANMQNQAARAPIPAPIAQERPQLERRNAVQSGLNVNNGQKNGVKRQNIYGSSPQLPGENNPKSQYGAAPVSASNPPPVPDPRTKGFVRAADGNLLPPPPGNNPNAAVPANTNSQYTRPAASPTYQTLPMLPNDAPDTKIGSNNPRANQYQTLQLAPEGSSGTKTGLGTNTMSQNNNAIRNQYESANSQINGSQNSNGTLKTTGTQSTQYQQATNGMFNTQNSSGAPQYDRVPSNQYDRVLSNQYDKVPAERPALERKNAVSNGLNGNYSYKPISAPKETNPNKKASSGTNPNKNKSTDSKKKTKKGKNIKIKKR